MKEKLSFHGEQYLYAGSVYGPDDKEFDLSKSDEKEAYESLKSRVEEVRSSNKSKIHEQRVASQMAIEQRMALGLPTTGVPEMSPVKPAEVTKILDGVPDTFKHPDSEESKKLNIPENSPSATEGGKGDEDEGLPEISAKIVKGKVLVSKDDE